MGAGGLSASASTSIASRSGDASSGIQTPLQYNAQFTVGSGASAQTAAATNGAGAAGLADNLPLYIGLGIAAVVALAALAIYAKRA